MNPLAYRLVSAWALVASVVGAVDAYDGMSCNGRTGDYVPHIRTGDPDTAILANGLLAIPYGAVRGMLFNVGQSLGTESQCGSSYTHQFAGGLTRLFNTPVAGKTYLLSQALFGLGGAALGGIGAEEVHVFSRSPAFK